MSSIDHRVDDDKWKIFTESLRKVSMQVHPHLEVKMEALQYIEKLIIDLLHTMCNSKPLTTADVIDQVEKTFPKPIDRWAIQDANIALNKKRHKKEKSVTLPVDKVHPLLKELLGYRLDTQVTVCIVAVLEYVAADILKLVGNYVKHIQAKEITEEDVRVSMCADKVLNNMFFSNDSDDGSDASGASLGRKDADRLPLMSAKLTQELTQNYEDLVKDLINSEQQYIRELELIIKVFRAPFVELFPNSKDIDVIFTNILDVHSFSLRLLSTLEDTVEMTEQDQVPLIGGCFEEMLEEAEFDVYDQYMSDVTNRRLQDRLYALLKREDLTNKLNEHGLKDVVKYLLPKLLEGPIYHLKYCFNIMEKLSSQSEDEDRESFNQALGLSFLLKKDVDVKLGLITSNCGTATNARRQNYGSLHTTDRVSASAIMTEIQKSIENWEEKDINKQCYDFVLEGSVMIQERKDKKDRERYAFLFDNMLIMCKSTGQRGKNSAAAHEYRFKEKLLIKHIDVQDIEDTDDMKNAFEICERQSQGLVLKVRTAQEKAAWMAAFLSLLFRSNLDRMLDSKIKEEESAHALILPPTEDYPFSEEDSEENIVLEESQTAGEPPLIQGATLNKLIERLTYHMYADPNFVKRFLTTYRSFCSPSDLLDLLINRFKIPETSEVYDDNRGAFTRFKKEYVKPVQFRVLNVIRLWADHHFYDFEREEKLLQKLENFLDTIKGKVMRKWVESIIKILKRKVESSLVFQGISWEAGSSPNRLTSAQFNEDAPPTEWFMASDAESDKFNVLTLHPIEIARQETLIEFRLYKAVKPSELVGSVFTKKDKAEKSPNLMKLIQQTNRFIYWLEESILTTQNLDERIAVINRIIELMQVFRKLNNFNGVLCVVSALDSAPVHRLSATFEQLKPTLKRSLEESKELLMFNYRKYFETLRAIDPPCVPFFGVYMTNILKLEEGNPDCLPNTDLINFTKRRKVADITAEIQQYQNQPYNLTSVDNIQNYLEALDPWGNRSDVELDEYLFDLSLQIEPRNIKPPPKFSRRFDQSVLKSPGIKTGKSFKSHLPFINQSDSRFNFPSSKSSTTDDEDARSTISSSTPPHTPSTPITPPPRPRTPVTPPPRTPPANKNTPPKTPPPYHSLYSSRASILSETPSEASTMKGESVQSLFSTGSTATLTQSPSVFDLPEGECERYELQAPPLPPRRNTLASVSDSEGYGSAPSTVSDTFSINLTMSPTPSEISSQIPFRDHPGRDHPGSTASSTTSLLSPVSYSLSIRDLPYHPSSGRPPNIAEKKEEPPRLPPRLPYRTSVPNIPLTSHSDTDIPPRVPPRPPRTNRGIERSGSMPGQTENRYSNRRNSGDHVNMNGVTPGTPQLPPRTYRPPNHGRQRSQ